MMTNVNVNEAVQQHDSARYPYVVSIDVHDASSYAKIVDVAANKVLFHHNVVGPLKNMVKRLQLMKLEPQKTLVIYEAGSLGFYPYRLFTKAGYTCRVIAPSSIPQNNRRKKTNKRDCSDNLLHYLGGVLRFVNVPTETSEMLRDCNRYRKTLVEKRTEQQQRILGFIKRYGFFYEAGKTNWTKTHRKWLKDLPLAPAVKTVVLFMIDELEYIESKIELIESHIENAVAADNDLSFTIAAYSLLPGIGTVTAQTLGLEGGDLNRFGHPVAIPNFTGLLPGKSSSGDADPAMAITKEGNGNMRQALVCASKVFSDRRKLYSQQQIEKLPKPLSLFVDKMQKRLSARFDHLRKRNKPTNKIRCAIAREFGMFLWEYNTRVMPQLNKEDIVRLAA